MLAPRPLQVVRSDAGFDIPSLAKINEQTREVTFPEWAIRCRQIDFVTIYNNCADALNNITIKVPDAIYAEELLDGTEVRTLKNPKQHVITSLQAGHSADFHFWVSSYSSKFQVTHDKGKCDFADDRAGMPFSYELSLGLFAWFVIFVLGLLGGMVLMAKLLKPAQAKESVAPALERSESAAPLTSSPIVSPQHSTQVD